MASWDEYTQKATPEDADTLLIKDTAGAANKRTPFSGVWTWIVNKMTNAVIANLETTNKMIIPAINELNSKTYLLQGGTAIPENADMNTYTTPGNYYVISNAQSATLSNSPFGNNAFILKVEYANGVTYPRQIFTEYSTGRKAIRFISSSGGSWSDWLYFSDDAMLKSNMQSPNFITYVESSTTLLDLANQKKNDWYAYRVSEVPSDLPDYLTNMNAKYAIIVHTITKYATYIIVQSCNPSTGKPFSITGTLASSGNKIAWEDKA